MLYVNFIVNIIHSIEPITLILDAKTDSQYQNNMPIVVSNLTSYFITPYGDQ